MGSNAVKDGWQRFRPGPVARDTLQKTPSLVHKPAASEPNCRLNAGRFSHLSIFAEWGLKRANTRRGVFRVNHTELIRPSRARMTHAQV